MKETVSPVKTSMNVRTRELVMRTKIKESAPIQRGNDCELYRPRRHCGDFRVYHEERKSGPYTLKLLETNDNGSVWTREADVYCDMDTEEDGYMGGWTLMSNTYDSTVQKNYQQYVDGFGDPSKADLWIGLKNLHHLTSTTDMK
ncbi:unnamed protein product [Gongylonema pulchrum]|uniref:Fibrinogen C-terminal domain-containing protein n=1 Tax=Gongylonema pulchrum TaxID=637853 RepID=A0A183EX08_9BILA|nr:unnamed protein product [Gongylonema pulchrum]